MISREENELLTRVGPGTPMGELMRQYWVPMAISWELPDPDCAPLRVLLLGERLIAFRDSKNQVGLFAEACPHRGASLFFGHNAECGLRCPYHGWKFDVSGQCIEMPQEPDEADFKRRVRAKSYPCIERGGLIWAYLGPRETPPPLPDIEPNMSQNSVVGAALTESNWLQGLESDLDIHHLYTLHGGYFRAGRRNLKDRSDSKVIQQFERTPTRRMETMDTDCGVAFALAKEVEPGGDLCWGVGQFMFPFYSSLPQQELGSHWVTCRVPMDDTHTMTFGILHGSDIVCGSPEQAVGPEPGYLPNTSDWLGRFRYARNSGNDFMIDRKLQNDPSSPVYGNGVLGEAVQDAMIVTSMGPIVDRTRENLGSGDAAVVRARERLLSAARALAKHGTVPPGVNRPEAYQQKHGSIVLPRSTSWVEALRAEKVTP